MINPGQKHTILIPFYSQAQAQSELLAQACFISCSLFLFPLFGIIIMIRSSSKQVLKGLALTQHKS